MRLKASNFRECFAASKRQAIWFMLRWAFLSIFWISSISFKFHGRSSHPALSVLSIWTAVQDFPPPSVLDAACGWLLVYRREEDVTHRCIVDLAFLGREQEVSFRVCCCIFRGTSCCVGKSPERQIGSSVDFGFTLEDVAWLLAPCSFTDH